MAIEKKSKFWMPFWSYQRNSTANPAHLPQNWAKLAKLAKSAVQCCLAGSSKRAPRIFIFSIAMGADKLFYMKSIATYAPTFFGYIISVLAIVEHFRGCWGQKMPHTELKSKNLGVKFWSPLTPATLERSKSIFLKFHQVRGFIPASPRAATGRRPVAAPASVSERGRSTLFKN